MGGRGNCCTLPYAPDNTYHRIMLRFRPIAPKPAPSSAATAAGLSSSGGSSPDSNKGSQTRSTRGRRRYVLNNTTTSRKKKKKKKKKEIARCLSSMPGEDIEGVKSTTMPPDKVTLPLLPPPYDHRGDYDSRVVRSDVADMKPSFMPLGAGNYELAPGLGKVVEGGDGEGGIGALMVVVEGVTETWVEGEDGMGVTDEGRVRRMREDKRPSFISDGEGRVRWVNEEFRRMVEAKGGDRVGGVGLGRREEVGRCFACRVRMVCTGRGRKRSSMTSPCDVWRLDCGYFAWRLDVGAALRLGL